MTDFPSINYIDWTRSRYPDTPPYRWAENAEAPFTPLPKRLRDATLALVTSGGVHHVDQPPFNAVKNDLTYRELPRSVDYADLRITHYNQYSRRGPAGSDFNCVFPMQRLLELERDGIVGAVAATAYSFMGRCFLRTELRELLAPALMDCVRAEGADAVLFVPA
ncbi:MAG: hypothetical protein HY329_11200 [Chloroflexi bacterium]|nr:hypothetical protein [Chloroflexota bacterium]